MSGERQPQDNIPYFSFPYVLSSLTPKSSNPFFEPSWKRILRNVYFAFLKTRKMENSVACHAAIQPDSAPPQPPSLATGSEGSTQLPCNDRFLTA